MRNFMFHFAGNHVGFPYSFLTQEQENGLVPFCPVTPSLSPCPIQQHHPSEGFFVLNPSP